MRGMRNEGSFQASQVLGSTTTRVFLVVNWPAISGISVVSKHSMECLETTKQGSVLSIRCTPINVSLYLRNRERYKKTVNCNGFMECYLVYMHFQNFENLHWLWAIDVSSYLGNRERYCKTDNCNEFVEYCLVYVHFQNFENLNQLHAIDVSC